MNMYLLPPQSCYSFLKDGAYNCTFLFEGLILIAYLIYPHRYNANLSWWLWCLIFPYYINCIWHAIALRGSKNTLEESREEDIRLDMRKLGQTFLLNPKSSCYKLQDVCPSRSLGSPG